MGRKLSDYNKFMAKNLKGMKGKTKAQRQKIFKDAVRRWNAQKKGNPKPRSKPKSAGSSRSSSTTRRSNNTMGRKGGFSTQKLFKLARLGALALPAAGTLMSTRPMDQKIRKLGVDYFGVDSADGSFKWERLQAGWMPYLAAIAVTYGIPKIAGLIRGL